LNYLTYLSSGAVASMADVEVGLEERLAELLTQGCDDRIVINPKTGMHKYNGTNRPVPGCVRRSSCTFSIPTEEMFAEGVAALRRLDANEDEADALLQELCQRLMSVWKIVPGTGITMFPSGTDAEFLPLLVGLCRAMKAGGKFASIITATGEVGSGTLDAAVGRHFAPLLPIQHRCPEHAVGGSIFPEGSTPVMDAIPLKVRNAQGCRYPMDDLDQIVRDAVTKALGEDGYSVVVVHIVAGSKTGCLMPSLHVIADLEREYGNRVVPVVDACQTRMQDDGLQCLIEHGMAVLVTGSKFYGGPPFCGAALLPNAMVKELNEALSGGLPSFRDVVAASDLKAYISRTHVATELTALREMLPNNTPNLGLILRWHMALYQIEQYHSIPEVDRDRIVQSWMDQFNVVVRSKASPAVGIFEDISMLSEGASSPASGRRRSRTEDAINDCGMIKMRTINMLELKKRIGVGDDGAEQWGHLSLDEMKKLHTLMATDVSGKGDWPEDPVLAKRFFIAQPVALTKDFVIIRAAIGAPLVSRIHTAEQGDAEDLASVRLEDEALLDKMHALLCAWPFGM